MKNIWHKLLTLGVINHLEEIEIKHIKLLNALATFSGLFSLFYLIIEIPYYQILHRLILYLVLISALFFTVLKLNQKEKFLEARLLFNLSALAFITVYVLALGPDVHGQIYYLLIILTAFFIYPETEKKYQYSIIALTTLLFIAVEVYFYFYPKSLFPVPTSLLILFKLFFSIGFLFCLISFSYYIASHYEQAEKLLALEKKYSDDLLHSILPDSIIKRLKLEPVIADRIEGSTILFADIVGFTVLSTKTPPAVLVALLNKIFSMFDELTNQYGLEKIKTMGDAYMVAGGVPIVSQNHAEAIAEVALAMRTQLEEFNQREQQNFKIRIGIHTGPLIAGVIGIKKFVYDIWGDTVNIASRMESHGVPGEIQVSEATYLALKDHYLFEERGEIEVKGKGLMRVYFLKGKKSA